MSQDGFEAQRFRLGNPTAERSDPVVPPPSRVTFCLTRRVEPFDQGLLGEAGQNSVEGADFQPYPMNAFCGGTRQPVGVPWTLQKRQEDMEIMRREREPLARIRCGSHLPSWTEDDCKKITM